MSIVIDFFAGCLGGVSAILVGHPFDTIKVCLQTQTDGRYRGTIHCATTIYRAEKFAGFYKGMSSPMCSLMALNAIVFGVHANAIKQFGGIDQPSLLTHFIAGAAAGGAQAAIAAPSELVKLRIQIQRDAGGVAYRSPIDCAKKVYASRGMRGLLRGTPITYARDCPGFGIYFASYEYMAHAMSSDGTMAGLASWQLLIAGGGAGMLSWLLTYPIDVVKTRFQADDSYRSCWDCARKTYAERGWRTFTVGLGSTMLRAFPSNAATFFTVEWTYRLLLKMNAIDSSNKPNHLIHYRPTRYIPMHDLWQKNTFLLPEAGTTLIDPILRSGGRSLSL